MRRSDPVSRATLLAAAWAQRLKLPAGNAWEPAIVRYMLREHRRLGGDMLAWGAVEGITRARLGLGEK